MSKRVMKAAVKRAAYDDAMKEQPARPRKAVVWVKHKAFTHDPSRVFTQRMYLRLTKDWHPEGSIQEIEQRENCLQMSLF